MKTTTNSMLLCLLLLGSGYAMAQTKVVQEPSKKEVSSNETKTPANAEQQKYEASLQFDVVKKEVLSLTKQLQDKGIKVPEYPTHVNIDSITAYAEELRLLNNPIASKP